MSDITTHILDTSAGRPAAGVSVTLLFSDDSSWVEVASGTTDEDGRIGAFAPSVQPGTYRLRFETDAYFRARQMTTFYPHVEITFQVTDASGHYHVPLLLNPFGYSTYRGS